MMRVIAGTFGGRRLKGNPPPGIRPTSDKLRETLFNVLGPGVSGAAFLDVFSGTGGVGIEAISRGAQPVYFIEQSRKACEIIRTNLASLGVNSGFVLLQSEVLKALEACERKGVVFDIVFLDPPYEREDLYESSLNVLGTRPLLAGSALVVVEHSKRMLPPAGPGSLRMYRSITHGDSALSFYRNEEA